MTVIKKVDADMEILEKAQVLMLQGMDFSTTPQGKAYWEDVYNNINVVINLANTQAKTENK